MNIVYLIKKSFELKLFKMDPVKRTQEKSTLVLSPVLQGFYFVYYDYQRNGGVFMGVNYLTDEQLSLSEENPYVIKA